MSVGVILLPRIPENEKKNQIQLSSPFQQNMPVRINLIIFKYSNINYGKTITP